MLRPWAERAISNSEALHARIKEQEDGMAEEVDDGSAIEESSEEQRIREKLEETTNATAQMDD